MKDSSKKSVSVLTPVHSVEIPIKWASRATLVAAALEEFCGQPVQIQFVLFPSQLADNLLTDLLTAFNQLAKERGEKPFDWAPPVGQNDGSGE